MCSATVACRVHSLITDLSLLVLDQARVNIPDDRFKWLCDLFHPKSEVPAFLEIVDIAGLVRSAF